MSEQLNLFDINKSDFCPRPWTNMLRGVQSSLQRPVKKAKQADEPYFNALGEPLPWEAVGEIDDEKVTK